jgi:microcystin-dependent protein
MSAPFTPAQALELVSDPTASLCGNFVRSLLRLPVLFYQFVSYLIDADGNPISLVEPGDYIFSASVLAESTHRKLANGQELSKTTYAALYAKIGDVFATMDGQAAPASGNFRVPKVGGRFPLPVGALPTTATAVTNGAIGGAELHELDLTEIPAHSHSLNDDAATNKFGLYNEAGGNENPWGSGAEGDFEGEFTFSTQEEGGDGSGNTTPHNNVPPWFGCYVYISTGI